MFYEYAVPVAANTTESLPKIEELRLARGIIDYIGIQFPIGTRALTHCQLRHHSFGSLPSNPSGSFASDGYIIQIMAPLSFTKAPYSIKAICWNDDDTYEHTITIRVQVVEEKMTLFIYSVFKGLEKLLKLVGIKV